MWLSKCLQHMIGFPAKERGWRDFWCCMIAQATGLLTLPIVYLTATLLMGDVAFINIIESTVWKEFFLYEC